MDLQLDGIDTNSQDNNNDSPAKKSKKSYRVFKGIGNMLQMLGTVGEGIEAVMAIYDFMHAWINGPTPSPEMAFMKAQFKVVNSKLDKILEAAEGLESLVETGIVIKDVNLVATDLLYNKLDGVISSIQQHIRRNKPGSRKTKNKVEKFLQDVRTERITTR